MVELKKTDTPEPILEARPPPDHLAPFISAFVHRNEAVDGRVVRLLPETRMSLQLKLADTYWVRERDPSAAWRRVPEVSLWGPRSDWAYGYASCHIQVYAFAFTPVGFREIVRRPADTMLNAILDSSVFGSLGQEAKALSNETFEAWCSRMTGILERVFAQVSPAPAISREALQCLASSSSGSIARAAMIEGVSPRQFLRRFKALHGFPPKLFQRLLRVDRMIRDLHPGSWEGDPFDPSPIAFADQPHAIREFRDLIGMTPREYAARKKDGDRTLRSVAENDVEPPENR